jgi:hypothetical protein
MIQREWRKALNFRFLLFADIKKKWETLEDEEEANQRGGRRARRRRHPLVRDKLWRVSRRVDEHVKEIVVYQYIQELMTNYQQALRSYKTLRLQLKDPEQDFASPKHSILDPKLLLKPVLGLTVNKQIMSDLMLKVREVSNELHTI